MGDEVVPDNVMRLSVTKLPVAKKLKKKEHHQGKRFKRAISPQVLSILHKTADQHKSPGKGLIDLSDDDYNCKFFAKGLSKEERRLQYLNMFLRAAKDMSFYINGLLLAEEMLEFDKARRVVISFKENKMQVAVKLSKHNQQAEVTDGGEDHALISVLDSLMDTCQHMNDIGVSMLMWSATFHIEHGLPTSQITNNCRDIALFASTCQKNGLVPIVSVELTMSSGLTLTEASGLLRYILAILVKAMADYNVLLDCTILAISPIPHEGPINTVIHSTRCPKLVTETFPTGEEPCRFMTLEQRRAKATSLAISQSIPPSLGILMSNSSSPSMSECSMLLNAFNQCPVPRFHFHVGFCFSNVIHEGYISKYAGRERYYEWALNQLIKNAQLCSDAGMGTLSSPDKSVFISNVTTLGHQQIVTSPSHRVVISRKSQSQQVGNSPSDQSITSDTTSEVMPPEIMTEPRHHNAFLMSQLSHHIMTSGHFST